MPRRFDPDLIPDSPNLDFESSFWKAGLSAVAGIDEAGRGCLAGPVTAAAVILPANMDILEILGGVRDSKQLSSRQRETQRAILEKQALAWAVGWASNLEIDRWGILPATRLAASRALEGLTVSPDHLLVDYLVLPEVSLPQTRLVKGDARSLSIASASILAKTYRDAWMIKKAALFPEYGFERNKGYLTAFHREALQMHGPSPLHRTSFAPLRERA